MAHSFTSGPWEVYHDGFSICAKDGHILSTFAEGSTTDEALANANLIAAAPDMHQALREASLALETLARRVFNDNGDHTINTEPLDPDVYSACYYAARTVRDALDKAEQSDRSELLNQVQR